MSTTFLGYLANSTTSLLSFPCGRDAYSLLVTCQDCQRAYGFWLCTISFPYCGEHAAAAAAAEPTQPQQPQAPAQAQMVAIVAQVRCCSTCPPTLPAELGVSGARWPYTVLLPCLEVCMTADRAYPSFLGFRCPLASFSTNES
jgi:calcium channel MID1